jgi:ribosomal-protein-alanine N-acetyltransferase
MTNDQFELKTKDILLRKIIDSDIHEIYKGLSNPKVIKHYGVSFSTLEATKEQMEWYKNKSQCWWAICSADKPKFYGAGGLNDISTEHKRAEIGLWLLPEFWGRGIMKEAMQMICKHGFEELGLHRIEGYVESHNANCQKAMAKLDFELEGTMKDYEIKEGQYISVDIYSRINRNL